MDKSVPARGKGSVRIGAARAPLAETTAQARKGGGGKGAGTAFGGKKAPAFKKGK